LFMLGILSSVAWSVQLAGWFNGPSSLPTVLLGGITGMLMARQRVNVRYSNLVAVVAGFLVGILVVAWQGSRGANGDSTFDRLGDISDRFTIWIDTAQTGGISTDILPFEVILLAVAWLTAFATTWYLFRYGSPWLSILVLGTGMMINLSYRPGLHEHTVYIFLALSIALFAHMTTMNRALKWQASGVKFPDHLRRLSLNYGLTLGVSVVVLTAVVPLYEPRNNVLDEIWDTFKDPFRRYEDQLNRLLSGVKGKGTGGLGFNETLPFRGPINLPEEPVMTVDTVYPELHPGRIYTEYTSQGWETGKTVEQKLLGGEVLLPRQDLKERRLITQRFRPAVETNSVWPVGNTLAIDKDGRNEVLAPLEFDLRMKGGLDSNLPADVKTLADDLKYFYGPGEPPTSSFAAPLGVLPSGDPVARVTDPGNLERTIRELLPGTLAPVSYSLNREDALVSVRVRRPEPGPLEQIAYRMDDRLKDGDSYIVDQLMSTASDIQLAATGPDYPVWVSDRYLQLPDTLPASVRGLTNAIINRVGAESPFEKVQAIQTYLQSQSYSQDIKGPKPDQDALEYFLFDTAREPCPSGDLPFPCSAERLKGYSQYFGSAATVMLRVAGVPSRMIAGYTAGDFNAVDANFTILGSDRHGWAQAYFPSYGWIDVEATPGYARFTRGAAYSQQNPADRPLTTGELFEAEFFPEEDFLGMQDSEALRAALARREGGESDGAAGLPIFKVGIPVVTLIVLIGAALTLWRMALAGLTPAEQAYVKMVRLGGLAGISRRLNSTPMEYADIIASRMPVLTHQTTLIAAGYQEAVYGRREGMDSEVRIDDLGAAWSRVRSSLLKRAAARLIGR
jgi:transglutaminase-like putative cysteine protease